MENRGGTSVIDSGDFRRHRKRQTQLLTLDFSSMESKEITKVNGFFTKPHPSRVCRGLNPFVYRKVSLKVPLLQLSKIVSTQV